MKTHVTHPDTCLNLSVAQPLPLGGKKNHTTPSPQARLAYVIQFNNTNLEGILPFGDKMLKRKEALEKEGFLIVYSPSAEKH